jgi:hypothetical protein
VGAELGERRTQPAQLERRDVDEAGRVAGCPLQHAQQLVDRAGVHFISQQACGLELLHQRVQVDAKAVGDVRSRREQPERREPERRDRADLDDVPRGLPLGKVAGAWLRLGG